MGKAQRRAEAAALPRGVWSRAACLGLAPRPGRALQWAATCGTGIALAYLLLAAASGTGRLMARHLNTTRRHQIRDQCALAGWKQLGLGFEYLSSEYLRGERRLQCRGAAPGTRPSCLLWSLQLQHGAKYLDARAKHFHMTLAVTWLHKDLPTNTAQRSQHVVLKLVIKQSRICPHATSQHIRYRNFLLV